MEDQHRTGATLGSEPVREWAARHAHPRAEPRAIRRPDHSQRPQRDRGDYQSRGDQLEIPDSIALASDKELIEDATRFATEDLGLVGKEITDFVRAARVAKDSRVYDQVARGNPEYAGRKLAVTLEDDEKVALRKERDQLFSESGILIVSITVAIAAFLQGHVQSSINGSASFMKEIGVAPDEVSLDIWRDTAIHLGLVNAMPFLVSAGVGVWLSMPVNNWFGRRGAMMTAAVIVFVTSLLSGIAMLFPHDKRWLALMVIRAGSGVGMGIKAVSSPILASETAIRFWRGSFVLGWQLWVAFGIMTGFLVNLIIFGASHDKTEGHDLAAALILGAPMVPAMVLFGILFYCPESPRYYMRKGSPRYSPKEAFRIINQLRECNLLAMKEMYILHKTVEEEYANLIKKSSNVSSDPNAVRPPGFFQQLKDLFTERRLRNALISSGTVNLAQPLSGINFMALYSGPFFSEIYNPAGDEREARMGRFESTTLTVMGISLGFGAINFLFGLPAFKTIDSLGRRKWLIITLPLMCAFLLLAGLSLPLPYTPESMNENGTSTRLVIIFLYLHGATYSPGMGPIPFTLASESFPLSHREIGCAFSVGICYGIMGVLCLCYTQFLVDLQPPKCLFLFAGLGAAAWVLVFLFVEETKELSLESLDAVFERPKTQFIRYQLLEYLPWLVKRYVVRERPEPAEPPMPALKPLEAAGFYVDGGGGGLGSDIGLSSMNDTDREDDEAGAGDGAGAARSRRRRASVGSVSSVSTSGY